MLGSTGAGKSKWIRGSDRIWDCPHVNKCYVLLDDGEYVTEYSTDWPEPLGEYQYVFIKDVLSEWHGRDYIPCDCKKEKFQGESIE